jgi:aminoglycoside phosphotransferase (APT) family kinase protein
MAPLPWEPDAPLDPRALALRVARTTGGAPPRLELYDEGWDNFVLTGPRGLLFRFAKRRAEAKFLRRETRLLRALDGRLPLEIPRVALAGRDFLAYRKIPGRSLSDVAPGERAAQDAGRALGSFLSALHATPARGMRLPLVVRRMEVLRRRAREAPGRLQRRGVRVSGLRRLLAPMPADFAGTPVLVHNDLLAEHILLRRGRVVGIIDWTDAGLGDPATDFAGLAHWGGPRAVDAALRAVFPHRGSRARRAGGLLRPLRRDLRPRLRSGAGPTRVPRHGSARARVGHG